MLRTVNVTATPTLKNQHTKGGMTDPTLYRNNNEFQRKFCSEALEEFSSKIQWKQRATILDVGSGDGGVTSDVLKPYIPPNFAKLIGIDISPEMVAHANLHHKDDRVEFKVMDITETTADLAEQFDHIFSFFTLHWIKEQEKALSNIYSMLVPGGDCAFVVLCYHPFFDIYRVMAIKPAWSQYTYDAEQYISPYHDSQKPEKDFTNLMKKCGFLEVDVRRKDCFFDYGEFDSLKRMATSVNPFVHRISPNKRESFMDDYMEELRIQMDNVCEMRINKKIGKLEIGFTLLHVLIWC